MDLVTFKSKSLRLARFHIGNKLGIGPDGFSWSKLGPHSVKKNDSYENNL